MQQVNTTWTARGILDFLAAHSDELKAMGVTKIGLFGSYVRGEQRPDSDIDILLEIEGWTWKRWATVWDFLENNFGTKVDLVPEKDLRLELRRYILPEARYVEIV